MEDTEALRKKTANEEEKRPVHSPNVEIEWKHEHEPKDTIERGNKCDEKYARSTGQKIKRNAYL